MTPDVPPSGGAPGERPARGRVPAVGILFVAAGGILLASSLLREATLSNLWPLFLLLPVAVLLERFLADPRAAAGVLVPVGLLSYLAAFFLWLNFTSWGNVGAAWPHFLLAPAFGLLLLFLATRNTALLVPVAVLTSIAAVFLAGLQRTRVAIALVLIAVGVVLIVAPALRRRRG